MINMDLWIRSQKGRLSKIEDIMQPIEDEFDNVSGWVLYAVKFSDTMFPLGMYSTKKRALEIIDEIQDILIGKYCVNLNFKNAFNNFTQERATAILQQQAVYEMPEE